MPSPETKTQPHTAQQREEIELSLQKERDEQEKWGDDGHSSTDFLQIVPTNRAAKLAFDALVDTEDLDWHHRQYIRVRGKDKLRGEHYGMTRSEDETPDEASSSEQEEKDIHVGYFGISFDSKSILNTQWALGRGSKVKYGQEYIQNRHVDILLAPPGSKFTSKLAAIHAAITMNEDSGAWLLKAGEAPSRLKVKKSESQLSGASKSLKVPSVRIDDEDICHDEYRCLRKPRTRLEVAAMAFSVQFTIDTPGKETKYCSHRNKALAKQGRSIPDPDISGIPFEGDMVVSSLAICRHGLGSGTFAAVWGGFDIHTGDPRAIKAFDIRDERDLRLVRCEIAANKAFGDSRGLVRMYGWRSNAGEEDLKDAKLPIRAYLVLQKGQVFHKAPWHKECTDWKLRRTMLVDLLEGLATIHGQGWIHRDITPGNIILLNFKRKQAALSDFGKLCFQETHTATALAAWIYLPPEIQPEVKHEYNQSIDIYMLAQAILLSWFPHIMKGLTPRERNHHYRIQARLLKETASEMAEPLGAMFSWAPSMRPTAKEALAHQCLKDILEVPTKTSERKRLAKKSADSDDSDAT